MLSVEEKEGKLTELSGKKRTVEIFPKDKNLSITSGFDDTPLPPIATPKFEKRLLYNGAVMLTIDG